MGPNRRPFVFRATPPCRMLSWGCGLTHPEPLVRPGALINVRQFRYLRGGTPELGLVNTAAGLLLDDQGRGASAGTGLPWRP